MWVAVENVEQGGVEDDKTKKTICVPYLNFMLHSFNSAHLIRLPLFILRQHIVRYKQNTNKIDSTKLSIFIIKLLSIGIEY